MTLAEKYRPSTWSEFIGNDKAIRAVRADIERFGAAGRAWFVTGNTGVGKTTLARIIAGTIAQPDVKG